MNDNTEIFTRVFREGETGIGMGGAVYYSINMAVPAMEVTANERIKGVFL